MPDLNAAYSWAINTCNAPNIGYSQYYRNQRRVDGITYYDCSSFINYALIAGGWETPQYAPTHNAFTTASEPSVLLSLGFVEVPANGEYLPGDIGWKTGHTEMCYRGGHGKGVFMGAHTSNATLPNQVSIGSSKGDANYERSFTRLFRYGDSPAKDITPSIEVCAAIAGNFWQESTINPQAWEGGSRPIEDWNFEALNIGFGIGQWTNTGGNTHGRLYQMNEYVVSLPPYNSDSGENQTAYIIEENYWIQQGGYSFANLSEFLYTDITDIEYLTHAFNLCWEGIHDSSWDKRVEYALKCEEYIRANQHQIDQFGGFYLSAGPLTEAQTLNNAMMIYIILNGWWDQGIDTDKRKKFKPWQMIRAPQFYK